MSPQRRSESDAFEMYILKTRSRNDSVPGNASFLSTIFRDCYKRFQTLRSLLFIIESLPCLYLGTVYFGDSFG